MLTHGPALTCSSGTVSPRAPVDRVHLLGHMEDEGLWHIRPFPILGPVRVMAILGTMGRERSSWIVGVVV